MNTGALDLLAITEELRGLHSLEELALYIANRTKGVLKYHQAIVWKQQYFGQYIKILSISDVTHNTFKNTFHQQLILIIKALLKLNLVGRFSKMQLPQQLQDDWPTGLPETGLVHCFKDRHNRINGGFILFVVHEPNDAEQSCLRWLGDTFNHTWQYISKHGVVDTIIHYLAKQKKRTLVIWSVLALIFLFFPVSKSVLAPVIINPSNPKIITAPMDGVIDELLSSNNDQVRKGHLVATLNKRELMHSNSVAKQALNVAKAKLKQMLNASFTDSAHRSEVKEIMETIKEKEIDIAYTSRLIKESDLRAPIDGRVIIDDVASLKGKPVATGEKIFEIITDQQVQAEIWLPVSEGMLFKKGDEVDIFLNASPLGVVKATLSDVSFYAFVTPSQVLAYRLIAKIAPNYHPQLGDQGTAKLMGGKVILSYYIFRKVIAAVRQMVGW